jgi:hypothetical protein
LTLSPGAKVRVVESENDRGASLLAACAALAPAIIKSKATRTSKLVAEIASRKGATLELAEECLVGMAPRKGTTLVVP